MSYARADDGEPFDPHSSFVARLQRDLTAAGFDVWFDRVSMPSRNLTFHQEIRDAVSNCDRVVLVVGPAATTSDYVRQEWQFAYFAAEKVITPILRQRIRAAPSDDEFLVVPDELKLLHCEDFRDDAQYAFHLEQLTRILHEPPPPLGKLIAVPNLPPHFLSRTQCLVVATCVAVFADEPVASRCYLVGNSLTWDTVPPLLSGNIGTEIFDVPAAKSGHTHRSRPRGQARPELVIQVQ